MKKINLKSILKKTFKKKKIKQTKPTSIKKKICENWKDKQKSQIGKIKKK